MKKIVLFALFLVLLTLPLASKSAADSVLPPQFSKELQVLQGEMKELKTLLIEQQKIIASQGKEIESLKLKVGPRETPSLTAGPAAVLPTWAEGLKLGGDFRLRYEGFSKATELTRDRNRFRFRLRYGAEKQLTDEFLVGFRLSTGANDDPTGSNQTLTGDFSPKNIFIDRAFAKYEPSWVKERFPKTKRFEVAAGKVPNPYTQTSGIMFWDQDVNPEGIYESLETSFFNERLRPFAILGQFLFNEQVAATDAELYAYQGGFRLELARGPASQPVTLTTAVAYYDFSDVTNSSNFIVGGTSLARGNTLNVGGTSFAAGDFNILNAYQDVQFKVGMLPVKLFGEYDINLHDQTPDPDDRDQAYQYGLSLGSLKKRGDWEVGYYYAYIEPNAVVGAISESDFGEGHTNKLGNAFRFSYLLTDFLRFNLKASIANNVLGADDETRRFQTDLEWKF